MEFEGQTQTLSGLAMQPCPHCETTVVPMTDGTCPSCRRPGVFEAAASSVAPVAAKEQTSESTRTRVSIALHFEETIGKYLVSESASGRVLRRVVGTVALILFIPIGLLTKNLWEHLFAKVFSQQGLGSSDVLLIPVALVGSFLTVWLLVFGMRCWARRAETILRRGHHLPIFYLRSFQQDAGFTEIGWLRALLGQGMHSIEHALAWGFKHVGRMIAIGQPGEKLPPLGAARLYVTSGQWKQVFADLVEYAGLVILRLGKTEGVWWEMEQLMNRCDPQKVLIFIPSSARGKQWPAWRDRASELLSHQLPHDLGNAVFVGFDANWEPRLLPVQRPWLTAHIRRLMIGSKRRMREMVNMALTQMGRKPPIRLWDRPGLQWCAMSFSLALFAMFFVVVRVSSTNYLPVDPMAIPAAHQIEREFEQRLLPSRPRDLDWEEQLLAPPPPEHLAPSRLDYDDLDLRLHPDPTPSPLPVDPMPHDPILERSVVPEPKPDPTNTSRQ